jgi:hypothetical protein
MAPRHRVFVDRENKLKECSKCGEIKSYSEFVKDPYKSLGITSNCKVCRRKAGKRYRQENPEKVKASRRPPEHWRQWRKDNPGKNAEYTRRWRKKNREKVNAMARRRRQKSNNHRIKSNLRGRLNDALKRHSATKGRPISKLLGCTIEQFKSHLESRFTDGMSWDNYGRGMDKWHIDHIKPCNTFDLTKEEDQAACFHYTNMQPLWAIDNLKKRKGEKMANKVLVSTP